MLNPRSPRLTVAGGMAMLLPSCISSRISVMFIPMGTVVTVCMLVTIVFCNRFPGGALNRATPAVLLRIIGVITGAAGLWNVLWYGLQHLGEFWGHMALGSGFLMTLLSALLVLPPTRQPAWLNKLRPVLILALLLFAAYYALTIYRR